VLKHLRTQLSFLRNVADTFSASFVNNVVPSGIDIGESWVSVAGGAESFTSPGRVTINN